VIFFFTATMHKCTTDDLPAVVCKYSMEKHWASAHGTAIITDDTMRRQVEVTPKKKEWPRKKWETAKKKRR